MFSNVLRNIDTPLLKQQKEALTRLITEEKIPVNHPLVGLLGLITGLLIERMAGEKRVDVSMNYWRSNNGELCINFHSSLYSLCPMQKLALCSGLLLATYSEITLIPESMNLDDFMGMVEDVMGETILIRFGDSITTNTKE